MKTGSPTFWNRLKTASRFVFNYGGTGHGYSAAINTRYRGRRGYGEVLPEESEMDSYDRERIVSTLLDFRRNNPLVKSMCRLRETDVVGNGIICKPQSGHEGLDERLEELWHEFSQSPEVTQSMSMRELQQQLASLTMIFGDGGLLLTRTGRVQIIEGDRIGTEDSSLPWAGLTPNRMATQEITPAVNGEANGSGRNLLVDGVEVSKLGKPIAYHISERFSDGGMADIKRIPARNFLFVKKFIRPCQIRGVPELATVVNDLQDIDEYDNIEMTAAKVSATLSAVVKREGAMDFELSKTADGSDQDRRFETFQPGQFHYLEPDEDVSVISANGRPNTDAISYLTYRLRKIGATLGIPVEFLLMTIGKTSFSASQGMVLLYQQTVEAEQRFLMPTLTKLYRWKVANWLKEELIELPPDADPFRVGWQPPSFRWVNRAAQVKADTAYLQMGAISLDDVASTFGYDAATVLEAKAKNIVTAKKLAEQYGLGDYRELLNQLTTYGNVNLLDLMESEQ